MAVDVYSENMVGILSPRLSFSNDILEEEEENNETNTTQINPPLVDSNTFDFAFNVDTSNAFHSSTADELFSDGKILPTKNINKKQDQKKLPTLIRPCLDPEISPPGTEEKKKSLKEFLEDSIEEEEEEEPNTTLGRSSFWKFRRSNSLNCDRNNNSHRKKSNGSWKVLSRSGSTGMFLEKIVEENEENMNEKPITKIPFWKFRRSSSLNSEKVLNVHPSGTLKNLRRSHSTNDHNNFRVSEKSNQKPFMRRSSSLNCDIARRRNGYNNNVHPDLSRSYSTGSAPKKQHQFDGKLPQKKQVKNNHNIHNNNNNSYCYYGNCNGNVKVSPVLNLPSPYISSVSVDLFSFGSLFCNGNSKDRKKRK